MQHAHAIGVRLKRRIAGQSLAEQLDEGVVQLDQVERIAGAHGRQNVPGDGSGAGAYFEDAAATGVCGRPGR